MAYEVQDADTRGDCLFIVNGELRGVGVPLDGTPARIGFTDDCDVMLMDGRGSTAEAILLRRSDSAYSLEAERGRVKVGGRYLKPRKPAVLPDMTPVSLGPVDMVIARSFVDAERAVHLHQRRSIGRGWAASLMVALGAIGMIGLFSGKSSIAEQPSQLVAAPVSIDSKNSFMPSLAANALAERFDKIGLSRLKASANRRDRVVVVHGKLRPSETSQWNAAQSWFDSTYGDSVQLDPRLTVANDAVTLPFKVEAVWMGETPRLTLHDGSQRHTGDGLPGGWRLDRISVDKVEISKNGETLVVPL